MIAPHSSDCIHGNRWTNEGIDCRGSNIVCVTAGLWVHSFMLAKPAALYFLLMFRLLCSYFNIKLSFAHGQFEQWIMSWIHQVATPPLCSELENNENNYAQMMGFNRPFQFLPASLCLLQELNLWFTVALFFFLCLLQAISCFQIEPITRTSKYFVFLRIICFI